VQTVRASAGIIDVGTLGKIEVNGPDAAEFLERLYTGRYAKMKVGTTRYVLMCDETGVIIDDGVAARLADDRFYVTATTTGADAVYREMQRWAILWKLNVVLINLTGTYAAMNLAGPMARRVLAALTDVPLDHAAFPYLGVREGHVAGVPARLLRVGFVGEMGYEVHVPRLSGAHVWDAIMQQGAAVGIRPFGVEAQRILRMEKGHIIIGQDTDGLTFPFEAGMDWTVKMDKPFFVGQRSLVVLRRRRIERTLIGFALAADYRGPTPKECHLVIRGEQITGRVTSVAFSPTLGRVLGLAYVAPNQSAIGNSFAIRVDGAKEVRAEVVRTPFYDPDNQRQSESADQPKGAAA
jgi:sarcosine oxidase subunit alpha